MGVAILKKFRTTALELYCFWRVEGNVEENPFTIESFGYLYIKCFIVALNDFAFLRFLSETPKSSRNLVRTAGYTIFARSVYARHYLNCRSIPSNRSYLFGGVF